MNAKSNAVWQGSAYPTGPSIEFFATSLAALAKDETDPKHILESVLHVMGVDKATMLCEQAQRYGYGDAVEHFEMSLLEAIDNQLFGLKACQLTAIEREQRRLIASL